MEKTPSVASPDLGLSSARCDLRKPRETDAEAIFRAVSDDRFPTIDPWSVVDSTEAALQRISEQIDRWESREGFHFSIELRSAAELVGQVCLSKEPEPRTWLLGYWIAPDRWGAGLATEAAREALHFAFGVLAAKSVWAGTALANSTSKRVLDKLGFEYKNQNPCGYTLRGRAIPTLEYELVQEPAPAT